MSSLKHMTEDQLLNVLRSGIVYRRKLNRDIKDLEDSIARLKVSLNGSDVRSQWALKYLTGDTLE